MTHPTLIPWDETAMISCTPRGHGGAGAGHPCCDQTRDAWERPWPSV